MKKILVWPITPMGLFCISGALASVSLSFAFAGDFYAVVTALASVVAYRLGASSLRGIVDVSFAFGAFVQEQKEKEQQP